MDSQLAVEPDNRAIAGISVLAGERADFATRFQPGQVNNPRGRPGSARFRRAFLKHLRQEVAEDISRLDCVADAILTKAETGNVDAFTAIRDTVDGKPQSRDDGAGVVNNITVEILNIGGNE